MAKTATLSIRIDPKTKRDAEKIFAKFGLSLSTAVNMFFHQAINTKVFPFQPSEERELRNPNLESQEAMREGDQILAEIKAGKRQPQFKNVEEFKKAFGL